MKTILALVISIFPACLAVSAQQAPGGDKVPLPKYDCTYSADSGHFDYVEKGKVIKIIDGNTVVFLSEKGRKKTVDLLSVDVSSNHKAAREFLEKTLLNVETELVASPAQFEKSNVNGLFELGGSTVSEMMLERGLGRYKASKSYQISNYNDCVAKNAGQKAKREKLGVWSK